MALHWQHIQFYGDIKVNVCFKKKKKNAENVKPLTLSDSNIYTFIPPELSKVLTADKICATINVKGVGS